MSKPLWKCLGWLWCVLALPALLSWVSGNFWEHKVGRHCRCLVKREKQRIGFERDMCPPLVSSLWAGHGARAAGEESTASPWPCCGACPCCQAEARLCDGKRLWSSADVFGRGAKCSCWARRSSWELCEQVAPDCNLVVIEHTAYLKLGFLVFSWWFLLVPFYWCWHVNILLPSLSKTFLVLYLPWLKTYMLEHHVAPLVSRDKQCKDHVLAICFKIRSCGRVLVSQTWRCEKLPGLGVGTPHRLWHHK